MSSINPEQVRLAFPALSRIVNGQPAVFLDGPGGTQSPQSVIDAMIHYLRQGSSNLGGPFLTSREADDVVEAARLAMADMLNAQPEEIVFGQNMTSLTFSMSRALSQTWEPGDEIIVTNIDHDANISPWMRAAEDRGVTVRRLDFHPENCTLALESLESLLTKRTRLIAVNYASNAVGTINDIQTITAAAHDVGALVYVDAVHYAPHGLVDVRALDCDFLACSVYKFFGPHTGVLFGKYELLDELRAYKVRPAPALPPGKWETGTQSFESLAGVTAAVDYLAALGGADGTRRERLVRAMAAVRTYEAQLSESFLAHAAAVSGLHVFGITDVESLANRTPTFAISLDGYTPEEVATRLGEAGIFVWHGHYYAVAVMERLGTLADGGLVRIGFIHYNTAQEMERLFTVLHQLADNRPK